MTAISMQEASALQALDARADYLDAFEQAATLPQFNPVSFDALGELFADDKEFAEIVRLTQAAHSAPYEQRHDAAYALGAWIIRRADKRSDVAIEEFLKERG